MATSARLNGGPKPRRLDGLEVAANGDPGCDHRDGVEPSDAMAHYEDPRIKTDDQQIALRMYYFPVGTKRIRWERVAEVREHDMGAGITGGRWRIWGSGDLVHWMPLDIRRPKKRRMFIFHLRESPFRPCITPDDPEAFKAVLVERGIRLVPLEPPYED
jgi:hypothetical protein